MIPGNSVVPGLNLQCHHGIVPINKMSGDVQGPHTD